MTEEEELRKKLDEHRSGFLSEIKNSESLQARRGDLKRVVGVQAKAEDIWLFLHGSNEQVRGPIVRLQYQMAQQGSKVETIKRQMGTVDLFLGYLHRVGVRPKAPKSLTALDPALASSTSSRPRGKVEPSTDGEPLGDAVVQQLLSEPDRETIGGKRDWVALHLIGDYGLGHEQILLLDVGDFNRDEKRLRAPRIRHAPSQALRLKRSAKASTTSTEREPTHTSPAAEADLEQDQEHVFQVLCLRPETHQALCEYLEESGHHDQKEAPLFCSLDRKRSASTALDRRLTKKGLYNIVASYAKSISHPEISSRRLQQAGARRIASQRTSTQPISPRQGE